MKKILLLIILAITSVNVVAQYHSLIDESKKWVIKDHSGTAADFIYHTYYYFAFFSGDTIFNGITYKKLHKQVFHQSGTQVSGGSLGPFTNDTLQPVQLSHIYFREDTAQKKIWRYSAGLTKEELLMDFSGVIGDTLPNYLGDGYPIVLDSISSVTLLNNEKREKRN